MARPASKHPTELELEMLKIIWRDGPSTVRQMQDALASTRKLAVTSVLTIMNIMVDKGYLSRKKEGPAHVYRPRISEKTTSRKMLKDLVNRVFDGSTEAVMVNLLESADLNQTEIRKLRRLLKRKSGEG